MKLYLQNAVAAIIKYEDKYLFQLRDKKKNIFFPEHWGLFGGAIEKNEDRYRLDFKSEKPEKSEDSMLKFGDDDIDIPTFLRNSN